VLNRGPLCSRSILQHSNIALGRIRGQPVRRSFRFMLKVGLASEARSTRTSAKAEGRRRVRGRNAQQRAVIFGLGGLGSMVKYIGFLALHSQAEPVKREVKNRGGVESQELAHNEATHNTDTQWTAQF
jgi:hypothetical protein